MIQNVTLIGGTASSFDNFKFPAKRDHWLEVLSNTVNGTIKNVYATNDLQLNLLQFALNSDPLMGTSAQFSTCYLA